MNSIGGFVWLGLSTKMPIPRWVRFQSSLTQGAYQCQCDGSSDSLVFLVLINNFGKLRFNLAYFVNTRIEIVLNSAFRLVYFVKLGLYHFQNCSVMILIIFSLNFILHFVCGLGLKKRNHGLCILK